MGDLLSFPEDIERLGSDFTRGAGELDAVLAQLQRASGHVREAFHNHPDHAGDAVAPFMQLRDPVDHQQQLLSALGATLVDVGASYGSTTPPSRTAWSGSAAISVSRTAAEMSAGDVANFVLGGIPGEAHDLFVAGVEPGHLVQAASAMADLGITVGAVHRKLGGSVASLEGRWQGAAATAFETDIWHPLSQGLGVLERECHGAASQLAQLAVEAEQAHVRKVEAINQEMQDQLPLMAATWVVASPQVGGAISRAVGSLAARLGGELVARIVAGIVDAIAQLLSRVLAAFARLFEWVARRVNFAIADRRSEVGSIFGRSFARGGGLSTTLPIHATEPGVSGLGELPFLNGKLNVNGTLESRARVSRVDAISNARKFLGGDAREIAPNVWRSSDGLQQFRPTSPGHANFEVFNDASDKYPALNFHANFSDWP